jgi:hypothetical protein
LSARGVVVPKRSQPAVDDYLRRVMSGESVGELLFTETAMIEGYGVTRGRRVS